MPKKSRASRERESSEEPQFVVEVIKAARVSGGEWEYRVKWANYDSSEETWEPEENLENCRRLLSSFWRNVGMDNGDYPEGYEVKATPSWIKQEKQSFQRNNTDGASSREEMDDLEAATSRIKALKEEPSSSKGKAKEVPQPTSQKKRGRPPKNGLTMKIKKEREADRADESDSTPLSSLARTGKKRAKRAIPSSSDEDEDRPLAKIKKPRPNLTKGTARSAPSGPQKQAAVKPSKPAGDSGSESAGSLFSGKSGKSSSPEVSLGATVSTATGSASTSSGPKNTTVPTKRPAEDATPSHQRKRQIMEMPMPITGTAGNSTKARLAQRGQQPPPPPPPTTASTTAPGVRPKVDLSTLSFKKKSATATAAASPVQTGNSPTAPAVPPIPRRSVSISESARSPTTAEQPAPATESHYPVPIPRTTDFKRPAVPPIPRRTSMQLPPKDPIAEADKFLSDIMPAEMAAPMREDPTPQSPIVTTAPSATGKTIPPPLPRIPKKWKWSGEMFMDVSHDRAERVCDITLHDATEPLPNGLRFSICLKGDSVRLSAFHDIASLPLFLDACARVQQFARVAPQEPKDANAVKQIAIYMLKRSFFSYAHLYMDETSVALLIIFPSGHSDATQFLKVPTGQAGDALLQAALVPWELRAKDFHRLLWKPRTPTMLDVLDPDFTPMLDEAGGKVVTQRRFYQALHILKFPKALYDFMSAYSRQYCIWYTPGDHTHAGVGFETWLLMGILATTQSVDVGYKADTRIVFVHVGALATLHNLHALAERRLKHRQMRFVTYGTHPSVPSERWSVRELYPVGGIVTFTPSAIIQGHYRVLNRIRQLAEHPLWECYVLPSVVAFVAKLTCQGIHPLQAYDEGNFVHEELLKAIEDGSLALLQAPPPPQLANPQVDPSLMWTRWNLRIAGMDARGILEECLKLAGEQYANTPEADLPLAIEKEIERDLVRMQTQPAIMDNYRRFVLFRTRQDTYFAETGQCGIECTTHDRFDFKDDYFEASNDSGKK
ncbi:hypothetical protein C8Q77DRAFT_1079774 [Trametes polyzona]|nr:hypothetical protein C8Q77DRAFT_1079774 [Trametes polyzona]